MLVLGLWTGQTRWSAVTKTAEELQTKLFFISRDSKCADPAFLNNSVSCKPLDANPETSPMKSY